MTRTLDAALVLAFAVSIVGCTESHERARDGAVDARPPTGVLARCASEMVGVGRDCGWDRGTSFSCTPGAMVQAACGVSCGLGTCNGDAMIRVCAGENECTSASAVTQDDDGCGSLCPEASFRCPAGGRFTILTAPFSSPNAYSCSVVVR